MIGANFNVFVHTVVTKQDLFHPYKKGHWSSIVTFPFYQAFNFL